LDNQLKRKSSLDVVNYDKLYLSINLVFLLIGSVSNGKLFNSPSGAMKIFFPVNMFFNLSNTNSRNFVPYK